MNYKLEEDVIIAGHVFRYVESELLEYRTYKTAVAELEKELDDLRHRSNQLPSNQIRSHNQEPGDPVGNTALRVLLIEDQIKQKLGHIRKIEAGLGLLSSEVCNIVEKKYFSGIDYTNEQIIIQFRLNRNHFYKIRNEIIYKFAMVFGLI